MSCRPRLDSGPHEARKIVSHDIGGCISIAVRYLARTWTGGIAVGYLEPGHRPSNAALNVAVLAGARAGNCNPCRVITKCLTGHPQRCGADVVPLTGSVE